MYENDFLKCESYYKIVILIMLITDKLIPFHIIALTINDYNQFYYWEIRSKQSTRSWFSVNFLAPSDSHYLMIYNGILFTGHHTVYHHGYK